MKKLGLVMVTCFMLMGCATTVQDLTKDYSESMADVKNFAKVSAEDWNFGVGLIKGSGIEPELPRWVFDELGKVGKWVNGEKELTDEQLGYLVTVRFRMASPIIRAIFEQYAPALLGIRQVAEVLAVLGIL